MFTQPQKTLIDNKFIPIAFIASIYCLSKIFRDICVHMQGKWESGCQLSPPNYLIFFAFGILISFYLMGSEVQRGENVR